MLKLHTNKLKHSLIVSCQARAGEPFDAPVFIAEFAKSAELGGADAVRIDSPENVRAVKQVTNLPILGIDKRKIADSDIFITPTKQNVLELIDAGADIIGLDGTNRKRPEGVSLEKLITLAHEHEKPVFADIATLEDAEYAIDCGADMIATTLSGYTNDTSNVNLPNFDLLQSMIDSSSTPVFLEGGVTTSEHVKHAIDLGAHGVVIGKSITMPHAITKMYKDALDKSL